LRSAAQGRPEDLYARLSGDQFVALFEDLSQPTRDGRALAERLRSALAPPIVVNGEELRITLSVGVATVTEPDRGPEMVLAGADSALHSAKHSGRDRVAVHEVGDGIH